LRFNGLKINFKIIDSLQAKELKKIICSIWLEISKITSIQNRGGRFNKNIKFSLIWLENGLKIHSKMFFSKKRILKYNYTKK
jgi:hypothetical protein